MPAAHGPPVTPWHAALQGNAEPASLRGSRCGMQQRTELRPPAQRGLSLAPTPCRRSPAHERPPPCSGPLVSYPKYDPTTIQCDTTDGGPWASCALSLCPFVPTRRRHLLEPAQCDATPITTSCLYNQAASPIVADCDLAGFVDQGVSHTVSSMAIKTDPSRTSQTRVIDNKYTQPFYP